VIRNPAVIYPLEGTGIVEEVRFFLYDRLGGVTTGAQVRVRREKNPDTLVFEAQQAPSAPWKPVLILCTIEGKIGAATFGITGGGN
jgi:hypothetical protein